MKDFKCCVCGICEDDCTYHKTIKQEYQVISITINGMKFTGHLVPCASFKGEPKAEFTVLGTFEEFK